MDHVQRHTTLKKCIRVLVIIVTWGLVALVPDQPKSFFEGVIVAAFASCGEYASMCLDEVDSLRFWISLFGAGISVLYLIFGLLGLGGHIELNLQTMEFSFGKSMPIPNATEHHWSYYSMVETFLIFVMIPVFEAMLKPPSSKKENAPAAVNKSTAQAPTAESVGGGH